MSVILRQSILLVEEAGGPGENHQQTLTNFITYWLQVMLNTIKQTKLTKTSN
jgi:hypothetical protein